MRAIVAPIAAVCLAVSIPSPARAARVIVVNGDGAGEGFNDPTAVTPAGGNPATTRGAARLAALQYAADTWGRELDSAVPIEVGATFDLLMCTSSSAVLGSAGTSSVHRDFPSAPKAGVWYAQALANSLAGMDLDPTDHDIEAEFNSGLDDGTCFVGHPWYYGLDGNAPTGTVDFVSVALHELAHGLGFATFVNLTTGAKDSGFDDAFMLDLEQHGASPPGYPAMTDAERVTASESDPELAWTGSVLDEAAPAILTAGLTSGEVRLYGPATQAPGSSVNHFSTALTPDELMEPFLTHPNHDLRLTAALLRDTGWRQAQVAVPGLAWGGELALALTLALGGVLTIAGARRAPT
jgi:hypothetical protein